MKVWNEIELVEDALRHLSGYADHLFVYDDCSEDGTTDVLFEWATTEGNLTVVEGVERHPHRPNAQGGLLDVILQVAKDRSSPDWVIQLDVDERLDPSAIPPNFSKGDGVDGYRFRLFDHYITPEDVDAHYSKREWIGPEYRDILMIYRAFPNMSYGWRDQREMWGLPKHYRIKRGGYVHHYGKAVSVERWERQCTYYGENFPEPYRTKWLNRRGKAIKHDMKSDFGKPLIKWEERHSKGIPLV